MFRIICLIAVTVHFGTVYSRDIIINSGKKTWNIEIESCEAQGRRDIELDFGLGFPSEYKVKYEDITGNSTVIAYGDIELSTQAGTEKKQELKLTDYSETSDQKTFLGVFKSASIPGGQVAESELTFTYNKDGGFGLLSRAYAVSLSKDYTKCAIVKADIKDVKIIL